MHSRRRRLSIAVLLAAALLGADRDDRDDRDSVRQGFGHYKDALIGKNGAAASAAVSANSLAYYDRMRALALTGEKSEIQSLDGAEQMLVLALRALAPAPLLRTGSPSALIAYAVDEGMISPDTVARTELGAISVAGDRASAGLVVGGEPAARGTFLFHREDGSWKFDLEHAVALSRGVFRALAAQQGVSEERLILGLLSAASQRPIGAEIWRPLPSR